jgi:hypothetical protein
MKRYGVAVVLLALFLAYAGQQGAAASVTKRVAVFVYNYETLAGTPKTTEMARARVFTQERSVRSYYLESSRGQLTLDGKLNGPGGDVFGPFTISNGTACSYAAITAAVNAAAQAAGVDLAGYDYRLYFGTPKDSSCTIAGYTGTSFIDNAGMMSVGFTAHELGHILGAWHSSAYRCYDGAGAVVAISSNCTTIVYPGAGDPDVLGGTNDENRMKQLQAFHRGRLGWLLPSNTQTVTSDGTYTIVPIEQSTSAVQVLRIPFGSSGKYYYLDFRQPAGVFDNYLPSDPYVNGVAIRIAPDYAQKFDTLLIDTTPETLFFTDAPLTVGRSFTDPAAGITVTTLAAGPSGATVRISFGSSTGPTPTATATPAATPTPAPTATPRAKKTPPGRNK